MSTPGKNVKSDLAAKKVQQEKLLDNLKWCLSYHDHDSFSRCLAKDPTVINVLPSDGVPLFISAIHFVNLHIFKNLMPYVDVNQMCPNRIAPLISAAGLGHEEMVQDLLNTKKVDPNTFCSANALTYATQNISSYALVEFANWDENDTSIYGYSSTQELAKQLKDWFHQRGAFDVGTDFENPIPFPNKQVLKATYSGNTDLVSLLLSKKTSPWMPSKGGHTPWEVVQEPCKYSYCFKNNDPEKPIKLLSMGDNILSFEMEIENRSSTDSITVTFDYRLGELQELLLAHAKKNPHGERFSKDSLDTIARAIANKLGDQSEDTRKELEERMAAMAVTVDQGLRQVARVEEESKQHHEVISSIQREKNNEQAWKLKQAALDKDPKLKAFRTAFNTKFRGAIGVSVNVAGGGDRPKNATNKDKAASALSFIATLIPSFGASVVGAIAQGIQFYINKTEEEKHKQIGRFFDNTQEQELLSQRLAIILTEYCLFLKTIKDEQAATKCGEKLAAAAMMVILNASNKDTIEKEIFNEIVNSGIMNSEIREYSGASAAYAILQAQNSKGKACEVYYYPSALLEQTCTSSTIIMQSQVPVTYAFPQHQPPLVPPRPVVQKPLMVAYAQHQQQVLYSQQTMQLRTVPASSASHH